MKYKAIIFDLDGTLLNTIGDIRYLLNDALGFYGLPQITEEQARSYIGDGAKELVMRAMGEGNEAFFDELFGHFKANYVANDNSRSTLYEGEDEALKELSAQGVKLAVLSNKPHAATLGVMEKFFKDYQFVSVHGQKDGEPLKPSLQSVTTVLDELGVSAKECLVVGDGETDIRAAQVVGTECVSVLWGYRTKESLEAAGGKIFVSSFKEFMRVWNTLS